MYAKQFLVLQPENTKKESYRGNGGAPEEYQGAAEMCDSELK